MTKQLQAHNRLATRTDFWVATINAEIFGLKYPDIDWSNDVIRIRRAVFFRHGKHHDIPEGEPKYIFITPKSDYSFRGVDLSPARKKELRARFMQADDKHGLIFKTSTGAPIDPKNAYERWFKPTAKRASEKAARERDQVAADNLNGLRLHDCRHTFGSWKLFQGEDLVYVSKQMGHSKVSVTADIYAHELEKRRPRAAAKTDDLLFGTPEVKESAK